MNASDSGVATSIVDRCRCRYMHFDSTQSSRSPSPQPIASQRRLAQPIMDQQLVAVFSISRPRAFWRSTSLCVSGAPTSATRLAPPPYTSKSSPTTPQPSLGRRRCPAATILSANIYMHVAVAQAVHRLHITARHIAGCDNILADAGSRAAVEPFTSKWQELTYEWSETPVPAQLRYMYRAFDSEHIAALAIGIWQRYAQVWREWSVWRDRIGFGHWLPRPPRPTALSSPRPQASSSIASARPTAPAPSDASSQRSDGSTSAQGDATSIAGRGTSIGATSPTNRK
ncbi:hypothetical protein SPRG_21867 [Saprolegnia parasitica CBS 223.65]|uniref:Uncharacterized protein n=1 Tax=Saprolegnia parasitica (strain CBS 223.65) TaxID=695850 RepID=A0A067BRL4_SAPPC|nr:hypothetical protein SPRG_21867 [Saprolegnia parasitica CBS 223.65]KDO17297.1 hypothetical protein SPRG_21867 [Saprolegnia parasitica CBS 223.65]|eukprot:XP_012211996.1 hypothetical protein SPRG_21867 [Saprolegnia parasitica CBS 223.65]